MSRYEGVVKVWRVYQDMKGLSRCCQGMNGAVKIRKVCIDFVNILRGCFKVWRFCQDMKGLSRFLSRKEGFDLWTVCQDMQGTNEQK